MEGRALPKMITSQITSPQYNQFSQGLVCFSSLPRQKDELADTALVEEGQSTQGRLLCWVFAASAVSIS